jgi:hypothetical protein
MISLESRNTYEQRFEDVHNTIKIFKIKNRLLQTCYQVVKDD